MKKISNRKQQWDYEISEGREAQLANSLGLLDEFKREFLMNPSAPPISDTRIMKQFFDRFLRNKGITEEQIATKMKQMRSDYDQNTSSPNMPPAWS